MRVLVTGNLGYIGSVMAPLLARAGHRVQGLDCGYYEHTMLEAPAAAVPTARRDVRDVRLRDLEDVDAVCHLAGLSEEASGEVAPADTYAINHEAAIRLAVTAKRAGVSRFLYASSCRLYGVPASGEVVDESTPLAPVTPHAVAQVKVEEELHALADRRFTPVSLRLAEAYGLSPAQRTDLLVNELVASALLTGEISVRGDAAAWHPVIHVDDISRAFLTVLDAPRDRVHDHAFNVGADAESYRLTELAGVVADAVPGCGIAISGDPAGRAPAHRVSFAKLARHLPAFQTRWTARAGAGQLVSAFRRAGLTPQGAAHLKRAPMLAELCERGTLGAQLRA